MRRFFYIALIFAALLCGVGNVWGASTLPIGSNDSGIQYLPIYSNQADRRYIVQFIYTSSQLSTMNGKQITKMSFPYRTAAGVTFSGVQVRLKEIAGSSFSNTSFISITDATLVYSNSVDATTATVVITFTTPYVYNGGNLLVDVRHTTGSGSYSNVAKCKATSAGSNVALYNYTTSSTMPTTGTQSVYRPDVTFTYEDAPAASCPQPKKMAISNLRSTTATFTWGKGKDETSWQYVCLPAATTLTSSHWNSATLVEDSTATVSGLSASTAYKFYVRAYCAADDQSTAISKAFTTPCSDVATASLPLTQNFNSVTTGYDVYNIPSCWSRIAYTSGDRIYPYVYSTGGRSNSKCLYFYGGVTASSTSTIILRPIEAATNTLTISFWYKNSQTTTSYGQAKIGYITDPEDVNTFHTLRNLTRTDEWTEVKEYALTGADPASFIAIQLSGGTTGISQALYIDDVVVAIPSSCDAPNDFTASAASATSANLSWTKGGDETKWNVRYSSNGGSTWTTSSNVAATVVGTTCSYTLSLPSDNTTYEIQVQADCGSSTSSWTSSAEVTTPCAAITGVGWGDDFESATAGSSKVPDCYKRLSGTGYPTYPCVYNFSSYAYEGSQSLQFYGGGTNSEEIIILPEFTETTSTLSLSLWYKNYDTRASYPQLQVGYITDPTDASTFNAVTNGSLTRVTSYTRATVPLEGATSGSRIAIRYSGGGANEDWTYIDSISISLTPTCYAPSELTQTVLTHNSVAFLWTASGHGEDTYQWAVAEGDAAPVWVDDAAHKVSTTSATVSGLTTGTAYKFYVRSYCGASDQSTHIVSSAFTPTCVAPTSLTLSNEVYNGVTITWSAGGDGPWSVAYSTNGGSTWFSAATELTVRTYTFDDDHHPMTPGTEYTIKVTSDCGSSATTTYTPVCPSVTAVTLSDKTHNSVTVNWTTSAPVRCNVRYKAALAVNWTTAGTNVPYTSLNITGLSALETYTFQVQPSCGGDWVAADETYNPSLTAPTPVVTPYDSTASVVWDDVLGATGYQYICVVKDASLNWNNATSINSNPTEGSPLVLTGLTPSTNYDLYVRGTVSLIPSVVYTKQSFRTNAYAPVDLTCSATTTTSLTFTWAHNSNGAATRYEYKVGSGEWTLLDNNVLTATLTGLSDGQYYTFYVRSYYAEGIYSDAVSLQAATGCGTKEIPYTENFSLGNPVCWTTTKNEWSSSYGNYWAVVDDGGNVMRFNAKHNQTDVNYLIMPPIYLFTDAELSFKVKTTYSNHLVSGKVIITDEVTAKEVNLTESSSFTTQTVDLAQFAYKTVTIKFVATTHTSEYAYIGLDDVSVTPKDVYIFKDYTEDHLWKTANNWDGKAVPEIGNDVIVRAGAVIDATTKAVAKSVVIDRLDERTGSIEIQPQGELLIAQTLRESTGTLSSSSLGATSASHLSVSTSAAGNGVLAIGTHDGTNRATVNFYTKACKTDDDGYVNQFIGTPFYPGNDVYTDYYGSYIYKHNATTGAWDNVKRGNASIAFAGYNILRKDATPVTMAMQGTLCASDNSKVISLTKNDGEASTANVISNSWLAPIDIASIGTDAFSNCEATVYLFNAGSKANNEALGGGGSFNTSSAAEGNVSPGQFISLPVGSAPWTSPAIRVIPSMQGFIIKATGDNPTLTLNYSTMVLEPLKEMANATATAATRAPRRNIAAENKPDIMRLHIAGEQGGADIVYLLMREDFTTGYENGYDGFKMFGGSGIPQLYAVSEAGNMAVNCIPEAEGTIIAFEPRMDDTFRFTFTYDGEQKLYLNDIQAHTSTLIGNTNAYLFYATEEDEINRFFISATPIAQVTTEVQGGDGEQMNVQKVLIDNNIYIIRGDAVYSVTGELVK